MILTIIVFLVSWTRCRNYYGGSPSSS